MPRVTIERLTVHADARGCVFEPLGPDGLPEQRNAHLIVTEPGAVRGNHLHPVGTETLVMRGPALFRCDEGGAIADTEIPAGEVFRFTIPAGVPHALKNTGATPNVAISFVTVPHDPAAPNVVPAMLIPPASSPTDG